MSLQYKFWDARRFIDGLGDEDFRRLKTICKEIQAAEDDLRLGAKPLLQGCYDTCEGLCCRNLDLDAVFAKTDFVYLLTLAGDLSDTMAACLEKEKKAQAAARFTFDCIFLIDSRGPCLFPPNVRPCTCLVTFCQDHAAVKKEIARVKRTFFKLSGFMLVRKWVALRQLLFSYHRG